MRELDPVEAFEAADRLRQMADCHDLLRDSTTPSALKRLAQEVLEALELDQVDAELLERFLIAWCCHTEEAQA